MVVESLLHSIFFVIYLALAVFIINKNKKNILNQSIFLLMLVFSFQSLSLMVIRYPLTGRFEANIFMDVLSISLTASGVLVYLSIVFLTRVFKPKFFTYTILALYVLGFMVFQLYTDFASVEARDSMGIWIMNFNNQIVLTTLDVIHNSLLITFFVILFISRKRNKDMIKRKQEKIILITGLISYTLSLTITILSYVVIDIRLPMLNDVISSVFLFGFIYSIVKFELFELTPAMVVEQIIQVLPIGLIITDNNGYISRINKSLCTITKQGEHFFYNNRLMNVFQELIGENAIQEKTSTKKIRKFIINAAGAHKTVNIFHEKLFDSFNRTIGSITLIHDINELIKTQKLLYENKRLLEKRVDERTHELKLAKEKAEESNNLKTKFLNNISHEIRTPMNGIIGFSSLLDSPDITQENRANHIKIIQSSSHQLLRIIDDILEISILETKQEKLNETEFCLNDMLMENFSIFNLKSKEKNIPLYFKKALHDDQTHIISDKTKLNKILSNLLENAFKFTNEGFIEFGYDLEKPNLILYVKDTGIGITAKNHQNIFERFSQEDKEISREHGGLGLGLSICKENAKLLGGDITLESEKGKGSTFYVTIPYKPAQISNNNTSKNSHNIKKINDNFTILVAEDEEVNYLYIEVLFEDEIEGDFNLIHAKNGKEAVEICTANNNIDLVLMDIKMPIMNGHEATEKIKEKFPNLPIIAQTAYSTEPDKQLALKHGCDDFISKPIDKEKLFKKINKYLIMT